MWDYNPSLDPKCDIPLFQQISRGIARDIMRTRLRPGDLLPGSRKLATQLGVHRNTVVAAYEALASEGWVTTRRAGGTYVSPGMPANLPQGLPSEKASVRAGFDMPEEDDNGAEPFISLMVSNRDPKVLFLGAGVPDVRLFPGTALARSYRRVLSRQPERVLGIGSAQGVRKVRERLAQTLASRRGISCRGENIMLTRGTISGLRLVSEALLAPGDSVAVESPGYPGAWEIMRAAKAKLLPIPVDRDGMNVDVLEDVLRTTQIRAVFTTPHHQYPTTTVMSASRRLQLLDLAQRHRFAVIEDDYDYAFHYEGQPVWPLAGKDHAGQVIYLTSLSKLLAPGIRLGFIVGPQEFIVRLVRLRRRYEVQGDTGLEMAMADLVEEGEVARHLRRCRRIYQTRRDVLVNALERHMPGALAFDVPKGGLNLWVTLRHDMDMDEWATACAAHNVVFYTMRRFSFDGAKGPSARMCFAALNEKELEEAARRMALAYKKL